MSARSTIAPTGKIYRRKKLKAAKEAPIRHTANPYKFDGMVRSNKERLQCLPVPDCQTLKPGAIRHLRRKDPVDRVLCR